MNSFEAMLWKSFLKAEQKVLGQSTVSEHLIKECNKALEDKPQTDFYQDIADKVGISRAEAKAEAYRYAYGVSRKLILPIKEENGTS